MMQDFPKLLAGDKNAKVGFTQMARFLCFSAVKNNVKDALVKFKKTGFAESACAGESDIYSLHRRVLSMAGCDIKTAEVPIRHFNEIPFQDGARVVLLPGFGTTIADRMSHFKTPAAVKISNRSTLVLDGDVEIHRLLLDGALTIKAPPGAKIIVRSLHVSNAGGRLVDIAEQADIEEKYAIRGYVYQKDEVLTIEGKAGEDPFVIDCPF